MTEITEEELAVARAAYREVTLPVHPIVPANHDEGLRAALTAAFASRPSQGGEWDNVVHAACRVAWPNFDAFGKESKTKRLKEMREAMAWECKDYADGWIRYATLAEALEYQEQTGCIDRMLADGARQYAAWMEHRIDQIRSGSSDD